MHDKHVHNAGHLRARGVPPIWLAHIPEPAQHRHLHAHAPDQSLQLQNISNELCSRPKGAMIILGAHTESGDGRDRTEEEISRAVMHADRKQGIPELGNIASAAHL